MASLIVLIAWCCAPLPWEEAETAMQRYQRAEQAKEEALSGLDEAYSRVEAALEKWRSFERQQETELLPALSQLLVDLREEVERLPESLSRDSTPPSSSRLRRAERLLLQEHLSSWLQRRSLDNADLTPYVADLVAREAAGRLQSEQLNRRLAKALQGLYFNPLPFHEVWNAGLFARVTEAREYRERYNEYIAAGVELERKRHPEYFEPGGKRVRPGMVYIPGGTYVVGPNTGFARKAQQVTVRPFLMDQYEVTNAQYRTFWEALPEEEKMLHRPWNWAEAEDGTYRPDSARLDYPVTSITWRSAHRYAQWAGKRLPTEDEWEIGCRGRGPYGKPPPAYPWGTEYVAGRCNDQSVGLQDSVPVGEFAEGVSPFQLYQMAGNVDEWTASREDGTVLKSLESNIAPVVIRGGNFSSAPENVGGLFRWTATGGSTRLAQLGFRCAADLK